MSLNETIQPRGQDQDPRNEVGNNIEKNITWCEQSSLRVKHEEM